MYKYKLLALLILAVTPALAQVTHPPIRSGASDPATCSTTASAYLKLFYNTTSNVWKYCSATDTWTEIAGGGTFVGLSDVTNGTPVDFSGVADGESACFDTIASVITLVNCVAGTEARADSDGTIALLSTDRGKQVNATNATANAVSIAQAGTTGFEDGYVALVCQTGAGATTITPTTSTINGAATFTWSTQYTCARVRSDGTNYEAVLLPGASSAQQLIRPGGVITALTGWPGLTQVSIEDWTDGGAVCSSAASAFNRTCGTGMTWWLSGGAETATMSTATGIGAVNHPGVRIINTGASSGNQAEFQTTAATAGSMPWDSFFDVIWVINGRSSDANTKHRVGLGNDAGTDPPTHGTYIEKLTTDTNWFMVVRAASSETRHDTGIAHGTGWFTARFRRISSTTVGMTLCSGDGCTLSTEVTFCASGCTVTSANVPSGTGDADARLMAFVETTTTAARSMMIDYTDRIIKSIVR